MPYYETAANKCPGCGYTFRTMADEFGSHPCPRCNYNPLWEDWGDDMPFDDGKPYCPDCDCNVEECECEEEEYDA